MKAIPTWTVRFLLAGSIWSITNHSACGHPDLEVQIARITAQIAASPNSPALYFQRADTHRQHADWTSAEKDYAKVLQLDPRFYEVYLARGQMLHDSGRDVEALQELNHFLSLRNSHGLGYSTRGRVLGALRRYEDAVNDFDQAILGNPPPSLEDYLYRARCLAACGTNRLREAVRGLDASPASYQALLSLQDLAVDLEVKQGEFDDALKRLDKHFAKLPRKEWWLKRRAEILEQAGKSAEASAACREALRHLEALSPNVRATRATRELEGKIREMIVRLPGNRE